MWTLLFLSLCQLIFFYAWASHIVFALLIVSFSFIIIINNVHKHPPPMPYGTVADSGTKLSLTLFIVIVVSVVTTLPWALYAAIKPMYIWNSKSQTESGFTITNYIVHGLYSACSIANPLIYAIRMKGFRKAVIKGIPCKRSLDEST